MKYNFKNRKIVCRTICPDIKNRFHASKQNLINFYRVGQFNHDLFKTFLTTLANLFHEHFLNEVHDCTKTKQNHCIQLLMQHKYPFYNVKGLDDEIS